MRQVEARAWPIDRLDELEVNGMICDARTLAALFVARGAVATDGAG
jgi:hypothetical protein